MKNLIIFSLLIITILADTQTKTVFIAGDSTVQSYGESYYPQQGWGYYLQNYLSDQFVVKNHAMAGRSSKSFYNEGRLETILNEIKKGDYLLIQFGINDSSSNKEERYAPVSGNIPGDEGSFEFYMAKYIEGAIEKGATPILITTVIGLKAYNASTKKFVGSYSNYCGAMSKLALYYNLNYVDLNSMMVELYNSLDYDTVVTYHLEDKTHFTETGANEVAKLLSTELVKYLK